MDAGVTLPEYRGRNQTASATTGAHSHDHGDHSLLLVSDGIGKRS
jgi:hypothetical protein